MKNPLNQPNKLHNKTFIESGSKTPMNAGEGLDKTVASKKSSFTIGGSNVPPGGRPMMGNVRPSATEPRNQWSREGGRIDPHTQTQGRVEVTTNHPNSKLNEIYG